MYLKNCAHLLFLLALIIFTNFKGHCDAPAHTPIGADNKAGRVPLMSVKSYRAFYFGSSFQPYNICPQFEQGGSYYYTRYVNVPEYYYNGIKVGDVYYLNGPDSGSTGYYYIVEELTAYDSSYVNFTIGSHEGRFMDFCPDYATKDHDFEYGGGFDAWSGNRDNLKLKNTVSPTLSNSPTQAGSNTNYVYQESVSTSKSSYFTSQKFLVTSYKKVFNFQYNVWGGYYCNFEIEVSNDDGTNWTKLWGGTIIPNQAWVPESIGLQNYLNQEVILRFKLNTYSYNGYNNGIGIDDISFSENVEAPPVEEPVGEPYIGPVLSDENYVFTRTYQKPMSNPISSGGQLGDVIEGVNYYDGLGRPMQNVAIGASPDHKDILTHIGYDAYGRQDKEWLPLEYSNGGLGTYRGDISAATNTFYANKYQDDIDPTNPNPFSQKQFEPSPLNRVLKQGAPGDAWRLNNQDDKGLITFSYGTNAAADNVKLYRVSLTSDYTPTLIEGDSIYYAKAELYKTVTKDENHDGGTSKNHTTEEFTDKQGRVVLKRTYGDSDANGDGNIGNGESATRHDTYYVYDDYGNLTFVLSPKIDATSNTLANVQSKLNELGYQYKYDHRNRLIEKKIPGKGWEVIVYNKLDQPIMTQDALQAGKSPKEWLFTKYDAFGRVVYTGLIKSNDDRVAHQTAADAAAKHYEKTLNIVTSVGTDSFYYTDDAYPDLSSNSSNVTLYTVNYYDDYRFYPVDLPEEVYEVDIENFNDASKLMTKGLATGSKVRVLTTNDWITTVTGYDKKGRMIYSKSDNPYLQTTDELKTKLDFVGKVVETTSVHTKTGQATITTIDKFTYDHMGRFTKQTQKINAQAEELIALNEYDELGQLKTKKVGNTTTAPLQTVDYTYNIRGWLKTINNPNVADPNKLFAFKLNYNTQDHGATQLYNGNISETKWRTANSDNSLKWYKYSYDPLNRIKNALYGSVSNRYDLNYIVYDKNGNITSLSRDGHTNTAATSFGLMDNLVYTYSGSSNKLTKVKDNGNDNYGFKDGIDTSNEFTYDANGNMLKDLNKGISSVGYNHLNLPTSVNVTTNKGDGTGTISYVYDATGVKLKKTATGNVTEYAGNYIYKNSVFKFFNQPEGYVEKSGTSYKYVYQYKDHLGNVRLTYADSDNNGSIDPNTEIISEKNYYPFGLEHKGYNNVVNGTGHPYTFLGQETNKELRLDWLTFRYRNYMPEIGRFFGVDPIAEEYFSISTYQFAHNNPVWKIELEGLEGATSTGSGSDDVGSHEPVKRALVKGGLGRSATKELTKGAGKVIQETTQKSALKKIAGAVARGATFITVMLIDSASPNTGENTCEHCVFGNDKKNHSNFHLPAPIDEALRMDDRKVSNITDNDSPIKRTEKLLDELKESSKPSDPTKGKSTIYERDGGLDAANDVFDSFSPSEVKDIKGGRIGVLPDGSRINVRTNSSDGRTTVEIIHKNNRRTKFRFNETE